MTIEGVSAYPLHWPIGRARSRAPQRARFSVKVRLAGWSESRALTVPAAVDRLLDELERLRARDITVSSNIPPGRDGLPVGSRTPTNGDHGVAVYFRTSRGEPHCLSCDRWDRVADNIGAIAHHVHAIRGMLRWGVADVNQAFAGHKMIGGARAWWSVLGFPGPDVGAAAIKERFRDLAFAHHPDRGGDGAKMAEIGAAYEEALQAVGGA